MALKTKVKGFPILMDTGEYRKLKHDEKKEAAAAALAQSLKAKEERQVTCPIKSCKCVINESSVMAHFLAHAKDIHLEWKDVYDTRRASLVFKPLLFEYGETMVLGQILYGGINKEHHPADRGLCTRSVDLSPGMKKYNAHLPLLVMACREQWNPFLPPEWVAFMDESQRYKKYKSVEHEMLFIWVLTIGTSKPQYCKIKIYDQSMKLQRSSRIKARLFSDPQEPQNFCHGDPHFLFFTMPELDALCDRYDCMYLEVYVDEDDWYK